MEKDGQIFLGRGRSERHWQECERQESANVGGSNKEEEKEGGMEEQ